MTEYVQEKKVTNMPRIPLEGSIDLTYRCNNNCRHCWLRIPANSREKENELTFDEIRKVVDEARRMGCRKWRISGGEPMLRPDFIDIFDYITSKSASYSINTNGTLITPKIAKALKKKGVKMVALYGATAEVHDHITRTPGSFETTIRGFAYLKEAGTGFTVQLIPMRDNYHQYKEMVELSESLSSIWRIGAPWLYLSADGDPVRNKEISRQRLDPKELVKLMEGSKMHTEVEPEKDDELSENHLKGDDSFFASCIAIRREFHIDPYAQAAFCCFVKDPALRYNLRTGNLQEFWDIFVPSLSSLIKRGKEYNENCGSCKMGVFCDWCPVYSFLEHRRYSAKIDYLCEIAKEKERFQTCWLRNHQRYFKIGGLSIQIESQLPITESTFHPAIKSLETGKQPNADIHLKYYFTLPNLSTHEIGKEIYRNPHSYLVIYKNKNAFIYQIFVKKELRQIAIFNHHHDKGQIFWKNKAFYLEGGLSTITLLYSDQLLLARALAYHSGIMLHASAVIFEGKSLLFLGHSGAGKTTIATLFKNDTQLLSDDRTIIRTNHECLSTFGLWSENTSQNIPKDGFPVSSIIFLEQAKENRLITISRRKEAVNRLLPFLIRPLVTGDWWKNAFQVIERTVSAVPIYLLRFDKNVDTFKLLDNFRKAK